MEPFADRLAAAVRARRSPVLVGLDPRLENLPPALRPASANRQAIAAAYERFGKEIIDVVADRVAAVKPQAAFFEQLGPPGCAALAAVLAHARERGVLTILDAKRNDIGTTAEAYAAAYLGADSAWGADALTVSPYLGEDSLEPFFHAAERAGAGVFVLVKTSNPGGGDLQDLRCEGRSVYEHVAERVEKWAARAASASVHGFGLAGAVVGATYPAQLTRLREAMPHAWLLVPGYGAQGAAAADVAGGFRQDGLGAIVNSSRALIFAHEREPYRSRFGPNRWLEAVAAAVDDMRNELASLTPAGRL